jgi:hypothetical protein
LRARKIWSGETTGWVTICLPVSAMRSMISRSSYLLG